MTTNPQNVVTIDCGNFLVRTTTIDDASDRWASWMLDPKNLRLVNSSPKAMTRADVATYIRKFDQQSHLLLSISEKRSGLLIGFFRVDVDRASSRCLVFLMLRRRFMDAFLGGDTRLAAAFVPTRLDNNDSVFCSFRRAKFTDRRDNADKKI